MKLDPNTEIDRLLRRHGRSASSSAQAGANVPRGSNGGSTPATDGNAHLDADELNAYAEGMLPPAARSRYVAHLADCDTCRKLVADLTLAAGVATEDKAHAASPETAPARSWREWLAALFTPPVLRYAVPTLALLAVVAVAFVALRHQQENRSLVARNEVPREKPLTSTTGTTSEPEVDSESGEANHAELASRKAGGTTKTTTTDAPSATQKEEPTPRSMNENLPAQATPAPVVAPQPTQPSPEREASPDAQDFAVATRQPSPANLNMSPIPSAARSDERAEAGKAAQAEKKDAPTSNEVNASTATTANSSRGAADERLVMARPASPPAAVARRGRSMKPMKSESRSVVAEDSAGETRSVGGRQFRRQGKAWVDTAYNPAHATTNIKRGSEQYRALIADEPGFRAIVEQLGGEVVVVWKNRAYRIH